MRGGIIPGQKGKTFCISWEDFVLKINNLEQCRRYMGRQYYPVRNGKTSFICTTGRFRKMNQESKAMSSLCGDVLLTFQKRKNPRPSQECSKEEILSLGQCRRYIEGNSYIGRIGKTPCLLFIRRKFCERK